MATRKSSKTKQPADFSDEDAVLAEVAKDLGEDPEDLTIEEDRGLTGFGEGTAYRISGRGSRHGGREWVVVEDHDTAYKLAVAVVRQDVEQEPEMFGTDLLASHIDTDRLRRDLHSDVHSMNYDRLEEMDVEDFWREAESEGMDVPEAEVDEDGDEEELRDPTSSEIDDLAEKLTDRELRDPMAYLSDIYGDEEAAKQAIKIAGIDEEALAEDVVDSDGWEHTLARYDGNSHETASNFVYWRDN